MGTEAVAMMPTGVSFPVFSFSKLITYCNFGSYNVVDQYPWQKTRTWQQLKYWCNIDRLQFTASLNECSSLALQCTLTARPSWCWYRSTWYQKMHDTWLPMALWDCVQVHHSTTMSSCVLDVFKVWSAQIPAITWWDMLPNMCVSFQQNFHALLTGLARGKVDCLQAI